MKLAKCAIVLICLAIVVAMSGLVPQRIGDRLQIALPLAGLGCAAVSGQGVAYIARFIGLEAVLFSSKEALGASPLNRRPDGSLHGFPSGHTAAATFGAAGLAESCLRANIAATTAVYLASTFTGASRVEAGRHTSFQVVAGGLLGWLFQIVPLAGLRRLGVRRRRLARG